MVVLSSSGVLQVRLGKTWYCMTPTMRILAAENPQGGELITPVRHQVDLFRKLPKLPIGTRLGANFQCQSRFLVHVVVNPSLRSFLTTFQGNDLSILS
jgi:hypothetical protein